MAKEDSVGEVGDNGDATKMMDNVTTQCTTGSTIEKVGLTPENAEDVGLQSDKYKVSGTEAAAQPQAGTGRGPANNNSDISSSSDSDGESERSGTTDGARTKTSK